MMNDTVTIPHFHFSPSRFRNITTKMLIRHKKNLPVFRDRPYHFQSIGRGATNICFTLSLCSSIDITYHYTPRVQVFPAAKLSHTHSVCKRTSRSENRDKNFFGGRKNSSCLSHKMNSTKNYYISLSRSSFS